MNRQNALFIFTLHLRGAAPHWFNRVVQKLHFLNNNRLKTTKNMDFVRNPCFFGDLKPTFGWQISNRVIEQVQLTTRRHGGRL
jgi:hypothetical protein